MSASASLPLRTAIIGGGAVAERCHLPAAAQATGVQIAWVVDRDQARAQAMASRFGVARCAADYREIFGQAEAAIVATPPETHADICCDLLRHGIHVLCEKPLAPRAAEIEQMIQARDAGGAQLAVAMVRRFGGGARLLRRLVAENFLGVIQRVDAEEGGKFGWPLRTGHIFQSPDSGGVIADGGSHILDLLLWILDSAQIGIHACEDDSRGGVGVNARVELSLERDGTRVPGRMELSFTRKLRNTIRIEGERGWLEGPTRGGTEVVFRPRNAESAPVALRDPGAPALDMVGEFAVQLDDFAASVRARRKGGCATAEECRPSIAAIEACRRLRQPMAQPWDSIVPAAKPPSEAMGRVLITGASGFLGCRLAERLLADGRYQVRAMVRRFSGPGLARLCRLPVEIAVADLLDAPAIAKAAQGCDYVVHCAYGYEGAAAQRKRVTVEGILNVLQAASQAGARKLIHLSSAVVHGNDPGVPVADESLPFRPGDDWYSQAKIDAENAVWRHAGQTGLPVVVFRPGLIHGPYSSTWTERVAREAQEGAILVDGGAGLANLVYVDNLVDAIVAAMESDAANGEAFLMADDERITWRDLYERYRAMIGNCPPFRSYEELAKIQQANEPGWFGRCVTNAFRLMPEMFRCAARSADFRARVKAIPWLKPLVRAVPKTFKQRLRIRGGRKGATEPGTAAAAAKLPPPAAVALCKSRTRFTADKAKRVFGYTPRVSFDQAMAGIESWLRYQRLIP